MISNSATKIARICHQLVWTTRLEMDYPWASEESFATSSKGVCRRVRQSSSGRNRLGEALCPLETARAVGTVVRWHGVVRHKKAGADGEGHGECLAETRSDWAETGREIKLRRGRGTITFFRAPEACCRWVDVRLPR